MQKLPTSLEIYNRIKTDSTFQEHKGVIVYFDAIKKKYIDTPLTKWTPIDKGGDIPWTRVYYIKYNDKIIWDREKRICLIDDIKSELENITEISENFKIISLNTLSDKYDKNITKLDLRKHLIITFISDSLNDDASIICLQEVNPELGNLITSTFKNQINIFRTNLDDNDIYILSKPTIIKSNIIEISPQKHFPLITVQNENNNEINILGVHLTSTSQSNSNIKRLEQTNKILKNIDTSTTTIILGDFNQESILQLFDNFTDAWNELHEKDNGFTFDPKNNKYAKQLFAGKQPKRIDKILYIGDVKPTEFNVIQNDNLSDHYPIECQFTQTIQQEQEQKQEFNNSTALTIIPPIELWEAINNLSNAHSFNYERWMPHINLLFGFVDRLDFGLTYKKLEPLFKSMLPFEVVFDKIDYFEHISTYTLVLRPNEKTEIMLRNLQKQICKILNINQTNKYNPHLSLGTFRDKESVEVFLKKTANFTWTLNSIHFISRIKENFMQNNMVYISEKIDIKEKIKTMLYLILGNNYGIYEGGSKIFYSDDTSDCDYLIVGNVEKEEFLNLMYKMCLMSGYFKLVKMINNEFTNTIKLLDLYDVEYDIHYMYSSKSTEIQLDKNNSCPSAKIYFESNNILDFIVNSGFDKDLYINALKEIKRRAKNCGIYGQQFGYISGVAWAVMLAFIFKLHKTKITQDVEIDYIVDLFCDTYYNWNYENPITISSSNKKNSISDEIMIVNCSLSPYENIIRTTTKSSFEKIKKSFQNKMQKEIDVQHKCIIKIQTFDFEILDDIFSWIKSISLRLVLKIQKTVDFVFLNDKFNIIDISNDNSQYQIMGEFILSSDKDLQCVSSTINSMIIKGNELYQYSFFDVEYV